jgi:lipopolysaccharide transport system ATP-binding protein
VSADINMSNIVLKAENISKQYRLGQLGTGTISHDLNRMWAKMRGKEDPYLKVGDSNDRSSKGESEYVWSLKDINFEVKRGDVLGVIGKNGAGKSTLLKILSQVTTPTTGEVKVKGRIAALLEVGTGFHPELTGRENIFLNGAILGMTKAEIKGKFDEIVEFSGVARYIDTPVKRYSSGMMVRLGFAVAAHLEPEILIVDEVLAVGDAEFQKKCLGKMKDVSGEGRTVLFVSHNMAAVKSLCTQAILLERGQIKRRGATDEIISFYLGGEDDIRNFRSFSDLRWNNFTLLSIGLKAAGRSFTDELNRTEPLELSISYTLQNDEGRRYDITLKFKGEDGEYFMVTSTGHLQNTIISPGTHELIMSLPANFFNEGTFYVDFLLVIDKKEAKIIEKDVLSFSIVPDSKVIGAWMGKEVGYIIPNFEWKSLNKSEIKG